MQTQKRHTIVAVTISTDFRVYTDLFQFDYEITDFLRNSGEVPRICHR